MMGIKEELHAKLARLAGSTPEMYERLCIEIKEADDSQILNMFAKTSKLISQLNEKGLHAELSPAMGYPFSFLCYLMDITDMNPFDYPEIETLDIVLKTFRTHKYIVIFTDKGGKAAAEDMLLQEKTAFRIIIKENLECNRRTRILAAINSGREDKMSLKDIPSDSKEAFEVIHNLDWDGVTENFMSTSEMKAARETRLDSFEKVWRVFSNLPYCNIENRGYEMERFEEARRACQLAYLKVYFPEEFNEALKEERRWGIEEEQIP